jgi:hypothetical protein
MVRSRAFGDNLSQTSLSGEGIIDAIFYERRLEFAGEGHRFFDLVRTGQAQDFIDGFVINKHEIFPVPLQEIQFSNGNWNQNQGY